MTTIGWCAHTTQAAYGGTIDLKTRRHRASSGRSTPLRHELEIYAVQSSLPIWTDDESPTRLHGEIESEQYAGRISTRSAFVRGET